MVWGFDLDFNFARRSSLWLEAAVQGEARVLGVERHEMPEYLQLTAGVRLPVF